VAASGDTEDGWFERLVGETAYRPRSPAALRVELDNLVGDMVPLVVEVL
jgi:hypothetical protein